MSPFIASHAQAPASSPAAAPADMQTAVALSREVRTVANLVYARANGWEGKLDIYTRRGQTPTPVVILIHGVGWVLGTKESEALAALA